MADPLAKFVVYYTHHLVTNFNHWDNQGESYPIASDSIFKTQPLIRLMSLLKTGQTRLLIAKKYNVQ